MATAISAKEVQQLENTALRQKNQLARLKQKADDMVQEIVQTAELSTAAFTMGVIDGRWNGAEVLGLPLSLTLAGASHLTAFLGVAPTHMRAFGNGFLAAYLTTLGNGVGTKMAMEAQQALSAQAQAAAAQAAR